MDNAKLCPVCRRTLPVRAYGLCGACYSRAVYRLDVGAARVKQREKARKAAAIERLARQQAVVRRGLDLPDTSEVPERINWLDGVGLDDSENSD